MQLTKEEENLTRYCEDFCPIYNAIKDYNASHKPIISCPTEMCNKVAEAYIAHLRNEKAKEESA